MNRGLFIAGSGKDAGKTTLSLGLAHRFQTLVPGGVSFIKPLGQKIIDVDGTPVGQDSWFISRALNLDVMPQESAPILASRGAAERFVLTGDPPDMEKKVRKAYQRLQRECGLVLVEGTGHPGVGSVFDLDNARVAKLLGIPAILVLDGGVGSTIDSFSLCSSLFAARGVPILGVVVNRVRPAKMEAVRRTLDTWFGRRGIPVFGYLPFEDRIARPSVPTVLRAIGAYPMFPPDSSGQVRGAGFIPAFDAPETVLDRVAEDPDKAVLVSVTRPEVLDALIVARLSGGPYPSAVVVCGGEPDERRKQACETARLQLFYTGSSLEGSAMRLTGHLFKTEPDEQGKIASILEMVAGSVDAEAILSTLNGRDGAPARKPRRGLFGFLRRLFRWGS